jgi:hypothetical protein
METAESFSDYLYKMDWDERRNYLMGLAKLKVAGMTYTKIGSLLGGYSGGEISRQIKEYEEQYKKLLDENFTKLEESLKRNDPDYDFMVDPRTVTRETCAMLMGGEEMKQTLEQLCNLNLSTTPAQP